MSGELLELVNSATVTLSAFEFSFLLLALTCCLVFRFNRVGLVAAYLFVYKWGWSLFAGHSNEFMIAYLVFGCLVCILGAIGMMHSHSN